MIKRLLRHAFLLSLVLLLAACEQMPPKPMDEQELTSDPRGQFMAELDAEAERAAVPPVAPPPAVADELLPPMTLGVPAAADVEPRFDIDVNRAPARAFFMSLVKDTPYNMIVHPDVEGRISLTLNNVTVPEVMDLVRRVYGYEYEHAGNGYVVLPARLQSKIFYVDYLFLQRLGESQTRVSSGELSSKDGATSDNGTTTRSSESNVIESFGSRIKTSTASDVWGELADSVRTIIGNAEGRNVIVSPQANMLVVRAMPSELREVEAFLASAQSNLQRQVILEAKILEITLFDGFQAGVNWAALGDNDSNGNSVLVGQTGGGTIFNQETLGQSEIAGQGGDLNPAAPSLVSSALTSAFGGVFTLSMQVNDFTAFIELLQGQGDVQVLSSPRVSTVNNQKAVIKVGTDEYFVTDIETTTTTGTATTTSPSVTLTPFFSGIALDVTPQISAEGFVTLHIHPTVSEVTDQEKEIVIGDRALTLPLAFSKVRESDSIIRAPSGQIVVIGGLMTESTKDLRASTPFLGDVPLIGGLFRHKQDQTRKTELVILLKPIVVDSDRVWQEQLRATSGRLQQLQRGQGQPQQPPQ